MTILVAEDDSDIRNLLKISLEQNGYKVICAQNGLEARELIRSQVPIDLALLDVMMPYLDGFNLLRKIRETSTLPVIFLTARGDDMDKVLGLGLGADDYIVKPFSIPETLARVGAQLRRSQLYDSPRDEECAILSYKNLSIDKDKCCAYKSGELIELGATEYKLLLFFMEHPEKVFTKKQLYQAVWQEDYCYDDNTVMVHISHLRNKVESNPQKPDYIKTIRSIGYKLHCTGDGE